MKLRDFQNRFSDTEYPHKELLEGGIEKGSFTLHSGTAGDQRGSHYLNIYEARKERLLKKEPKTEHILNLIKDVEYFCLNLSNALEEKIELWIFSGDDFWTITVFSSHKSKEVLGCIKAADDRRVSDSEYLKLWGRERRV